MSELCNGLSKNTSLTKIKLIDCNITKLECFILAESLKDHPRL